MMTKKRATFFCFLFSLLSYEGFVSRIDVFISGPVHISYCFSLPVQLVTKLRNQAKDPGVGYATWSQTHHRVHEALVNVATRKKTIVLKLNLD